MQTVEILEARLGIEPSSHCKYVSYYKNDRNTEVRYTVGTWDTSLARPSHVRRNSLIRER